MNRDLYKLRYFWLVVSVVIFVDSPEVFLLHMEEQTKGTRNVLKNALFYNRVSKAGSGTLIHILDLLSKKNGFRLARAGPSGRGEDIMLDYDLQVSPLQCFAFDNPGIKLYAILFKASLYVTYYLFI